MLRHVFLRRFSDYVYFSGKSHLFFQSSSSICPVVVLKLFGLCCCMLQYITCPTWKSLKNVWNNIVSYTQVLFFGFGWLFFMRQLFKDYEVLCICVHLDLFCLLWPVSISHTSLHVFTRFDSMLCRWCSLSHLPFLALCLSSLSLRS